MIWDRLAGDWRQMEWKTAVPRILILTFALIFFYFLVYIFFAVTFYVDWRQVYHPVGQVPLDPYSVNGFFNPPWLAWILAPFAWLPLHPSGALWLTLSVLATIWGIIKLDGDMLIVLLTLLTPAFLRFLIWGQIDVIPFVGLVLLLKSESTWGKGWGIVLMSIKPQVFGLAAVAVWLRLPTWRQRIQIAAPFVGVLLASFVMYGFWPLQLNGEYLVEVVDFSMWPYGIPIGLLLFGYAVLGKRPFWRWHAPPLAESVATRQALVAALSSYFFTPYIAPNSLFVYFAVLFLLLPRWLAVGLFVAIWGLAVLLLPG